MIRLLSVGLVSDAQLVVSLVNRMTSLLQLHEISYEIPGLIYILINYFFLPFVSPTHLARFHINNKNVILIEPLHHRKVDLSKQHTHTFV